MTFHLWQDAKRVVPPAPDSAVLLLHGLGSNADDLIELAPDLQSVLPRTAFLSPNAPFSCDMAPMGRQWFSLQQWTPQSMWEGAKTAAPYLEQMIEDVQKEFALPMNRIALLGFSQGCMMALHIAPRLKEPLAGVVGMSGALVGAEYLAAETISRPPIFLVHGQMDTVVPYAAMPMSAAALTACGFPVQTETRPLLQHGVDSVGLQKAAGFLVKALG